MQAEILLTLKLQQKLFADPRRISLLKHIALSGSISQGAKDAGISYKSAWDAINDMNQLSEHMLVERATGGKGGGGAVLTRYGQRLIQLYDLLGQIQQKAFDVLSDDDALPLDSLLAAISRFSLQTSARNQWFGTITARDRASPRCRTAPRSRSGATACRRAAGRRQNAAQSRADGAKRRASRPGGR
ncbi:DNA-binding domain of ModE / Molybdate-binding domain of ModE [Salmonella enterica subsp. enterica serovar Gaminara str. A4-567]|nr:DNA-binding domain of ModE / Molybdate-binding domain of ModE [Salmonella enterica subsp. enterica serovar Gaminara str. A4-567]